MYALAQNTLQNSADLKDVSCALCGRKHHQSVCGQSEAKSDADSGSADAVVSSVSSTVNLKAKEMYCSYYG